MATTIPVHIVYLLINAGLVLSNTYKRSGQGLIEIPADIPSDTTKFKLGSNQISNLTMLGSYASSLLELDLSNNGILYIPSQFFINCSMLEKLILDKNSGIQVLNNTFGGLRNLKTLYLRQCKDMYFESASLMGLINLLTVNLYAARFNRFPCFSMSTPYLQKIQAYGLSQAQVLHDDCWNGLDHLNYIHLFAQAYISFRPNTTVRFPPTLSYVNFGFSLGRTVGDVLSTGTHLTTLSMASSLHYKKLQNVPKLPELKSLKSLNLGSHLIECIGLGDVERIRFASVINLKKNKLQSFPASSCLSSHNMVLNISQPVLFPNLTKLNLGSNLISVFIDNMNAPELRTLVLEKNRINFIHWESVMKFATLEELDLHLNDLHTIDAPTMMDVGLPMLRMLDLGGNLLSHLPDLLGNIQSEELVVNLAGNDDIHCSIALCWLPDSTTGLTCAHPTMYAGYQWTSASAAPFCYEGK